MNQANHIRWIDSADSFQHHVIFHTPHILISFHLPPQSPHLTATYAGWRWKRGLPRVHHWRHIINTLQVAFRASRRESVRRRHPRWSRRCFIIHASSNSAIEHAWSNVTKTHTKTERVLVHSFVFLIKMGVGKKNNVTLKKNLVFNTDEFYTHTKKTFILISITMCFFKK